MAKTKTERRIYRQGDVLMTQVVEVPKGAKELDRERGRIVLAHGEVTGHSHAIASLDARFLGVVAEGAQRRFLEARKPVSLLHEEHGEIVIARGTYEVTIQREYVPGAIRNVAD